MKATTSNNCRLMSFLLVIAYSAVASGCASNRYEAPVTTFRDKTQQTIGVLGDFYSSRSSSEIDVYLGTIATDPTQRIAMLDERGFRRLLASRHFPRTP